MRAKVRGHDWRGVSYRAGQAQFLGDRRSRSRSLWVMETSARLPAPIYSGRYGRLDNLTADPSARIGHPTRPACFPEGRPPRRRRRPARRSGDSVIARAIASASRAVQAGYRVGDGIVPIGTAGRSHSPDETRPRPVFSSGRCAPRPHRRRLLLQAAPACGFDGIRASDATGACCCIAFGGAAEAGTRARGG